MPQILRNILILIEIDVFIRIWGTFANLAHMARLFINEQALSVKGFAPRERTPIMGQIEGHNEQVNFHHRHGEQYS